MSEARAASAERGRREKGKVTHSEGGLDAITHRLAHGRRGLNPRLLPAAPPAYEILKEELAGLGEATRMEPVKHVLVDLEEDVEEESVDLVDVGG